MGTRTQKTGEARRRIAVNVRRLRLERGLSQEKMAELADFHRTYISQLERCVTNISVDGLERLTRVLELDILDLLAPVEELDQARGSIGGKQKNGGIRKRKT